MLKLFKKNRQGKELLYEEKSENQGVPLTTESLRTLLSDSDDIVIRELYVNGNKKLKVTLCYVDGLINAKAASDDVLKPLMQEVNLSQAKNYKELIDLIEHGTIYYTSQQTRDNIDDTIADILNGFVALIFDKAKKAVTFDLKGFEKRSITEPIGESVIKGSRESFIEVIRVNTALVRRKIRTQNLKIKQMTIGQQTLTPIAICYIDGITNEHIINELENRLKSILIDGVLSTAFIEEYIVDHKLTPFPQVLYTERPEKFCNHLLDGSVGLLIDGLPTAFIVPGVISQFLQSPEDYSKNFLIATMINIIRYFSVLMTLLLPGFYIAISSFQHALIPTTLTITIISSKEGVPFPAFIEVFIMLIAFEILLEAGVRLPKNIGQAVSIVGAIIVGQSAVEANIVSPAVVIIVAFSVVAGFTTPNQDFANALRLWRFILTISSSIAGLFGLSMGIVVLLLHLSKIETFGVAYLSPYVANEGGEFEGNTIIRLPVWLAKYRPENLRTKNRRRQK